MMRCGSTGGKQRRMDRLAGLLTYMFRRWINGVRKPYGLEIHRAENTRGFPPTGGGRCADVTRPFPRTDGDAPHHNRRRCQGLSDAPRGRKDRQRHPPQIPNLTNQLTTYAEGRGCVMLDQFTSADVDLFYSQWALGARAKATG
jgi:hypothetical protein